MCVVVAVFGVSFADSGDRSFRGVHLGPFGKFDLRDSNFVNFIRAFRPAYAVLAEDMAAGPGTVGKDVVVELFGMARTVEPTTTYASGPPSFVLAGSNVFS